MAERYEKVVVRIVDLSQRGTDAGRIAQQEYQVQGIPSIHVFDKNGKLVEGDLHSIGEIENAVKKALSR